MSFFTIETIWEVQWEQHEQAFPFCWPALWERPLMVFPNAADFNLHLSVTLSGEVAYW
jgi:hypothetical protein